MSIATLSSKYQISIPKDVREAMNFKPGQKLAFLRVGQSLRLVPVRKMEDLFGIAKGANTDDIRDRRDRDDDFPVLTDAQRKAASVNARRLVKAFNAKSARHEVD